MCRLAYIPKGIEDYVLLAELFEKLNKANGGDGMGIGWFEGGVAKTFKGQKLTPEDLVTKMAEKGPGYSYVFHCRAASVGVVNDANCHPFINGNMITVHNGHIGGSGLLKLMLLENIEKYPSLTVERIMTTTDSDLLGYFIAKRGFDIVPMLDPGTVITMYDNECVQVYNGMVLEAMRVDDGWIFASEIPPAMGLKSKDWVVFSNDCNVAISPEGNCKFISGYCVDGKKLFEEKMKKQKKKGKYVDLRDLVEVA